VKRVFWFVEIKSKNINWNLIAIFSVTEAIEKKLIQRYDQIVEKSVGQKTTEVMASLKLFILFLCQFFVCDCL